MSDRLLKESDVMRIAFQLPLVVNSAFADAVKALPSAGRLPSICLCKDCRKYKYDWCHKFANVVKPDDFCSYAERRTDDEH